MGKLIILEYLILPSFEVSKLPFTAYHDVSALTNGVLGIPMKEGHSLENVGDWRYTHQDVLGMGNPFTGALYWKREGFTWAHKLGESLVLAERRDRKNWEVLSAKDGSLAFLPLELSDVRRSRLQVVGNLVLVSNTDGSLVAFEAQA